MMQDVNIEKANKESRTIEIGQLSNELNLVPPPSSGNSVVEAHSNFGPDMSGSDMDEASEVRYTIQCVCYKFIFDVCVVAQVCPHVA